MIKAISFTFMLVVYVSQVTQYFRWFVHNNELKAPPFKAIFVWGLEPLRVKSQSLKEREKRAYKEDGRGWWCYFSLSSCLVFMVFDRAWSLSPLSLSLSTPHPRLTLFTFNPMLEVPCALPVTFFSEDLNLASFSVNKIKTPIDFLMSIEI